MTALLLPMLIAVAEPNADEAKALLEKMDKKISSAKTLDVSFKGEMVPLGQPDMAFKAEGSFLLAKGNRVRMDMSLQFEGKEQKFLAIANGKKSVVIPPDGKKRRRDAPKRLEKDIRFMLRRLSIAREWINISHTDAPALDTLVTISNIKAGKKETVNKRPARIVSFQITQKKWTKTVKSPDGSTSTITLGGFSAQQSIWIDEESHLPLKRALVIKEGKDTIRVTETYSRFRADSEIDPKKFQLPKD